MSNFWLTLPRPFTVLAPMEDVTDYAFREVVSKLPRPNVFFTEFTSADALFSKGREATIHKLKYSEQQRPIVAQIWGINPESMKKAAQLVQELGFDGVDINMGCPDKAVMKKGAGGAACLNKDLSKKIITAVQEGAPNIPVSIKTRLGYDEIITDDWISFLLSIHPSALTIHGRTALQRSKGEANWEEITKAVSLRDKISPETFIIGNGDVKNYMEALEKHEKYKVDGVMIGRGIFSNPWVFERENKKRSKKAYLEVLLSHIDLFEKTWGTTKNFEIMKKFFKMYVNNFPKAAQFRLKLMETKSREEIKSLISKQLSS